MFYKEKHGSKYKTPKHGIKRIDLRKGMHKSMQKEQRKHKHAKRNKSKSFIVLGCMDVGLDH